MSKGKITSGHAGFTRFAGPNKTAKKGMAGAATTSKLRGIGKNMPKVNAVAGRG